MIPLDILPILTKQKPVFVLASSQRTGSTLLQRLLNSCPRLMIWGEHLAHLSVFSRELQSLRDWGRQHAGERRTFMLAGYDNFVPNLMPEDYELMDAARLYMVGLFAVPAAKLGRPLWGFKEVRYGAQMALFLQECFPRARFLHLTRNPLDCLISMRRLESSPGGWNREWTEMALQNWAGINESFLKVGGKIHQLLPIKLEQMVADPAGFIQALSAFLEISDKEFDENVFRLRKSWVESIPAEAQSESVLLNEEDRALLRDGYLVEIASQYGYPLEV